MKIICTQENLKEGFSKISSITKKSSNLPILSNVLLIAKEKQIKLEATNLEIGIKTTIRGKIEKEGKAAIPAQLFLNYINQLPLTKIILELKDDILTLSSDNFKAQFKCSNPSEFPLIPKINNHVLCEIKGTELKKAINQTIFASAKDESRPELAGILFKINNTSTAKAELVATDSYRLAEKQIMLNSLSKISKEIIIPNATLQELNRILDENENVEIFVSENQVKFNFGNTELISRLIEGQYPDYKKIIPENFLTKIKIGKEDFLNALKSSSLFSHPDTNEVNIEANVKAGKVTIFAESRQVGSSVVKISGKVDGKDEKIIFNYQYILEGLNCLPADEIFLMLNGDSGPGLIKSVNGDDYIYLVMPIKK